MNSNPYNFNEFLRCFVSGKIAEQLDKDIMDMGKGKDGEVQKDVGTLFSHVDEVGYIDIKEDGTEEKHPAQVDKIIMGVDVGKGKSWSTFGFAAGGLVRPPNMFIHTNVTS